LKEKLIVENSANRIVQYNLEISDLQQVDLLSQRHRLSKGELTSIAFAIKTNQAFLTDDQKARKLACDVLERSRVQTTPHLFGWLIFSNHLNDGDKDEVIQQHTALNRPLKKYFEEAYLLALHARLLSKSLGE